MERAALGEETGPRAARRLLDEGLAILNGLWSGEPFDFSGRELSVRGEAPSRRRCNRRASRSGSPPTAAPRAAAPAPRLDGPFAPFRDGPPDDLRSSRRPSRWCARRARATPPSRSVLRRPRDAGRARPARGASAACRSNPRPSARAGRSPGHSSACARASRRTAALLGTSRYARACGSKRRAARDRSARTPSVASATPRPKWSARNPIAIGSGSSITREEREHRVHRDGASGSARYACAFAIGYARGSAPSRTARTRRPLRSGPRGTRTRTRRSERARERARAAARPCAAAPRPRPTRPTTAPTIRRKRRSCARPAEPDTVAQVQARERDHDLVEQRTQRTPIAQRRAVGSHNAEASAARRERRPPSPTSRARASRKLRVRAAPIGRSTARQPRRSSCASPRRTRPRTRQARSRRDRRARPQSPAQEARSSPLPRRVGEGRLRERDAAARERAVQEQRDDQEAVAGASPAAMQTSPSSASPRTRTNAAEPIREQESGGSSAKPGSAVIQNRSQPAASAYDTPNSLLISGEPTNGIPRRQLVEERDADRAAATSPDPVVPGLQPAIASSPSVPCR